MNCYKRIGSFFFIESDHSAQFVKRRWFWVEWCDSLKSECLNHWKWFTFFLWITSFDSAHQYDSTLSQIIWFTVKRQLIQITYLGLSKRVDSESSYTIYWKEQTWKRNSWLSSVNQITWLGSSKRIDSESTGSIHSKKTSESGHLAQFIGKSRLWVKSCHLLKRANSLEQQLALFTESDRFARLIKSIESNDLIH